MKTAKKPKLIKSILSLIAFSSPALAQPANELIFSKEALGLVHNASIEVVDEVKGGCWTNAEAIKQKARLTLEQSGISVYLEPLADRFPHVAAIYITGFGERSTSSLCFGSVQVTVSDTAARFIDDSALIATAVYYEDTSVAIGPDLNRQFAEAVEQSINTLAANILSGRRDPAVEQLLEQHSEALASKPETYAEMWDRLGIDPPN